MKVVGLALFISSVAFGCFASGCASPTDAPILTSTVLNEEPTELGAGLGEFDRIAGSEVSWATWLADDIPGMIGGSELIVFGRVDSVVRIEPREIPPTAMPFTPITGKDQTPPGPLVLGVDTTFSFAVDRALKGDSTARNISVRQASGVYERILYLTGDDVPLVPGERYLLFLVRSRADPSTYETTAFIGGQFPVHDGIVSAAYEPSRLAALITGRTEAGAADSILRLISE